ncbi:hypothetical protein GOA99_19705 [Sinorhizobium meliloti]|jgi:hypothetical protein|uniref:hypothetical protein n=1 Tax=Rhizobium meliloti TaxID=382 RepID=UPI000FD85E7A|nr:hypothetical protein [Sinorhizobium meliloti]MDW9363623.1 hypothetical protein [Sinorhizobium meliloti]MDW9386860.1 hypothetical protein [Sinorhizobium meliloti]MDW9644490.1 hypothetical protein [Sinorhizobium meliloti]MDW9816702.1 hypothetical protein [Sinorhizobium meliloti]MQV26829.1 hypothetical protein [Sinorhizobium meliloti]
MPAMIPEKIAFLDSEITGLRSRIGDGGNSVQRAKLKMLRDIREDYQKSIDVAARREQGGAS